MSITPIRITPPGMENAFHAYRYFAQALDPIHVGTGGERLSRVDMAIVREAGTDLPKLPGTSLSGACRAYAALQQKADEPGRNCAGQGGEKHIVDDKEVKQHCGRPECPICQTFGYAKGGDIGGKKGVAQFADAHIVAFPVASTNGPLWVTSPGALAHINLNVNQNADKDMYCRNVSLVKPNDTLGLGWLALPVKAANFELAKAKDIAVADAEIAKQVSYLDTLPLVLVPDTLFSTIVNDNLEVRTSVAINPGTGAAEEGALFTYEAIPTGTLFAWDITYQGKEESPTRSVFRSTVEDGFELFAWLGVGGMNTRGMGRLRVLGVK